MVVIDGVCAANNDNSSSSGHSDSDDEDEGARPGLEGRCRRNGRPRCCREWELNRAVIVAVLESIFNS